MADCRISTHEADELAEHLLAQLSGELTCLSPDDYRMVMTMLWRELGDNKKLARWIREFYGEGQDYSPEAVCSECRSASPVNEIQVCQECLSNK